jgi:glutamine amidotransferase
MIAIIDYKTGNLRSVENAIGRLGKEYCVTADPDVIVKADHVIMPGVGEASSAMENLKASGLDTLIPRLRMPVLGICIGMQLMCRHCEEGDAQTIGIFNTDVLRFHPDKRKGIKVPHMGWNMVKSLKTPLFDGIKEGEWFYFVHSYAPSVCENTIALTENGITFSSALNKDNFFGTQFHPEKSGKAGEKILNNFINL